MIPLFRRTLFGKLLGGLEKRWAPPFTVLPLFISANTQKFEKSGENFGGSFLFDPSMQQ